MMFDTPLPIDAVLSELKEALAASSCAVLVAPPGAGKTTRVPLALMDCAWLMGRKILVLEPRRVAARAAAERLAHSLGERVGQRVGLRARLATVAGRDTRIEVITEGVFTRMIIDDPGLEDVGAVLFDEFHERSLDADFGLALALDAQRGLRPDLRLMPMSATLDGARISRHLGEAVPCIVSEGRGHPVETRHVSRSAGEPIEDVVAAVIRRALREEGGSVLAFLPGQREIRRVADRLADDLGPQIDLVPLHGGLEAEVQDQAIRPAPAGRRKVVLATAIAETSITIEGVRVVIDSGLSRVPRFEPDFGVTRLATVRVSLSAADQRRGRAGRTQPGVCYRLWDQPQTQSLRAFPEPEILNADLSGLMIDCARWGVTDPTTLTWLDPPPSAALGAARVDLTAIGALDGSGHLTPLGRSLVEFPLPPRLAAMLIKAAEMGQEELAAEVVAIMVEQGLGGRDADLVQRLSKARSDRSRRAVQMRRLSGGWARTARTLAGSPPGTPVSASPGAVIALAWPDRIARSRGSGGQFLLANGRGARLPPEDPLSGAPWLAVAELSGTAAQTRILLAAEITEREVIGLAGERIVEATEVSFDAGAAAVRARRVRRLDAIVLNSDPLPAPGDSETAAVLARGLGSLGLHRLPWTRAHGQLRARVGFLRANGASQDWPDLSDAALAKTIEEWLAPFLIGKTRLSDVSSDVLDQALGLLLPWSLRQRLDAEAPTHFVAPTGMSHAIDYDCDGGPAVELRVQEVFGLSRHPTLAGGRLPLVLRLTSPAHRVIQITRDLPGFWRGSWADVRADMRGRYPKHVWPDDPENAPATTRAKPR